MKDLMEGLGYGKNREPFIKLAQNAIVGKNRRMGIPDGKL